MQTIHKYRLPTFPVGKYVIDMPKEAQILKLGWQRNREVFNETNLCLWALIDSNKPLEAKEFYITTTGAELGACFHLNYEYIDSVMNNDGQYILHVFRSVP